MLADPLEELYPECYEEAHALARWAWDRGFPVINPPEALSNGIKSVQAQLWADSGIPMPPCERFECREELLHILESKESPVLIRGDWEHAQNGMHFCRRVEEARAIPESYRAAGRRDIWAKLYHKEHVYVFGDILMVNHLFFSDEPIVNRGKSTFAGLKRYSPRVRRVMKYRNPY